MRVLVAPDKFRGTLTARQAAEAIETGWRRTRPATSSTWSRWPTAARARCEALVDAQGGRIVTATATGPLGDPVDAAFGIVETADGLHGRGGDGAGLGAGARSASRAGTRSAPRPEGPAS